KTNPTATPKMSSKYRRQSIYLQRKSFSRGKASFCLQQKSGTRFSKIPLNFPSPTHPANSSIDPYDDSDHSTTGAISGSASALVAHQATPPPPSLESMKVI